MAKAWRHSRTSFRRWTRQASTALLDSIEVETYGSRMKLNQMANVARPEPRLLLITPDKSQMGAIERRSWPRR